MATQAEAIAPAGFTPLPRQLWVLLDFETTGLSCHTEDITQYCFRLLRWTAEAPQYERVGEDMISLVHTTRNIPFRVQRMTGITSDQLHDAPTCDAMLDRLQTALGKELMRMVAATVHASDGDAPPPSPVCDVFLVAHNGFKFDYKFLYAALARRAAREPGATAMLLPPSLHACCRCWAVDTYTLSQLVMPNLPRKNLNALYTHVTGAPMTTQHRADADVDAMERVFHDPRMQEHRYADLRPESFFVETDFATISIATEATAAAPPPAAAAPPPLSSPPAATPALMDVELPDVEGVRWTEQQRAIIGAPLNIPLRVIAGAGCAKTTTVLGRILRLLRGGITPQHILLTTFTREASADMIERLEGWTGRSVPIVAGTIDSIARAYLRDHDPDLFDHCLEVGEYKHAFLQFLRKRGSPGRQYVLEEIQYMMIDEFQDMNQVYYDIIREFAVHGTRVMVVGDDAQNIYTFNGSHIRYILNFPDHFPDQQTHYLTTCFRSTPEILRLANQSIVRNTQQLPKEIRATRESIGCRPEVHYAYNWDQDAEYVITKIQDYLDRGWGAGNIAILCRNCTAGGPLYFFEAQLTRHKIPHRLLESGGGGVGRASCRERVVLCTIHKAKGLEFDAVFVIGCSDTFFPGSNLSLEQLEEERRLFYVATTRARLYLHFSYCTHSGDARFTTMCRFLSEVPRSLIEWHGPQRSHFGCNDLEPYARAPPSLLKCVQTLRTEDIHALRSTPFLPRASSSSSDACGATAALAWQPEVLHRPLPPPDWVETEGITHEYATWLRAVVGRQLADTAACTGGLRNLATEAVVARLSVSRAMFTVYTRYRPNFEHNLYRVAQSGLCTSDDDADTESAAETIEDAILACLNTPVPAVPGADTTVHDSRTIQIDASDRSTVLALTHLITDRANVCGIPAEYVHVVCTRGSTFSEERMFDLRRTYASFYDATKSWRDVMFETFVVSWCEQLNRGRTRLLFREWDRTRIDMDLRPIAECVYENFSEPLFAKPGEASPSAPSSLEWCARHERDGMTCVVPLYDAATRSIIEIGRIGDGNAGAIPSMQQQLTLLLMVSLMRHAGITVETVRIYDPMAGVWSSLGVSEWSHSQSEDLWKWMVRHRENMQSNSSSDAVTSSMPTATPTNAAITNTDNTTGQRQQQWFSFIDSEDRERPFINIDTSPAMLQNVVPPVVHDNVTHDDIAKISVSI